ncbi:MAG: 1-acyl-sn-glycerol-3-phosphate acyltransferase [Candidatus Kapaibacterium sp.]
MRTKAVNTVLVILGFAIIMVVATVALVLRIVSFGLLTNFNRKYLIPFLANSILKMFGIHLENTVHLPHFHQPHFYTFNHSSFLDGFILMSLRLTDARILLSEVTLKYIPFTIAALSIGVLYIPTKENRSRRLKFFMELEQRIKREKFSMVGSSEGVHKHFHTIAGFNRGVYHTALVCGMPIVALFIYTPIESNPHCDFRPMKKGHVRIELLNIIPTASWTLENLDAHIEDVRRQYVARFNELHDVQTT